MKLSPAILKNLYSALMLCEPLNKWNLPLPEEIKFVVDSDPESMGTYLYDDGGDYEHIITISDARCGWLTTVISTLLHECIHMSRSGTITDAWTKHDATFRRRASKVAELGFDPLEL